MRKNAGILCLLATLVMGISGGCSRPEAPSTKEDAGATGGGVEIKGSDTMVHLVSVWAEEFMAAHPEATVSVTGGGSGTGIAAIINGSTDLCMSSRDLKEDERAKAAERGEALVEYEVALDGLSIVVHPNNPVNELTLAQLKQIYTGEVTDWSALGGNAGEIQVLSRESSSGTYVFFQEHVLDKQNYTTDARLMPATSSIIQTVQSDESAIGYVGLGYAEQAVGKVKEVGVKASADAAAVMPSVETVVSGEYPIARPLFIFSAGEAAGVAKQFLEFALGAEGQRIVEEEGYVPVP